LQELGERSKNQTVEIRKLFLSAIETLVNTLEAGDQYTTGHSQKVTRITLAIGQQLGLSSEELEELRWAALLHDVGKIAVDPGILNKPSELTSNEYRHIMTHAVVGPGLIKPFVSDSIVAMVSHHHDHYDGGGLDQSVAGEAIPRGARVLAVADAFQAMISDRPYRRALSREDALSEIMSCSGSQFDPVVADMLLKIMRSKQD
jgi:HD-GYP domain-containing protein (c-di-GMP phosphodiesterase class II)